MSLHESPTVDPRPSTPSVSSVTAGLHSTHQNKVYKALVVIRTHFIKQKDGVARIRQRGWLELVVDVLRRRDDRILDVALSILGNCCLEAETRIKVLRLKGIPLLADVLLKTKSQSIRNRACRTLANLSTDPQCCCAIHQVETLVSTIATSLVTMGYDHECQLTYIRALRLFADTPGHCNAVLDVAGLKCVCEVLKSTSSAVLTAALKTVVHLTKECTDDCIRQLLLSDAPTQLVALVSHSDSCLRDLASSRLLAFSKHESLRPSLGSAGAVGVLIGRVRDDFCKTPSHRLAVVNALCHYCQEAVNRVRMRDGKGLELMLMLLGEPDYSLIHNRLISALVCFLYDEVSIEILLQNGVVGVLVEHLRRCAHIVGASANTGLGLSDEECTEPDLVSHTNAAITESDSKQDGGIWFTTERIGEDSREMIKGVDGGSAIESVSRCDTNCAGGDEYELCLDEVESEVEAAFSEASFSDIGSPCCTANAGEMEIMETVGSGTTVDGNNQCGIVGVDSDSTTSKDASGLVDAVSEKELDVTKISLAMSASDDNEAGLACAMPVDSTSGNSHGKDGASHDEAEVDTDRETRYSIDSPTYKAVASWRTETPYNGPRNIMESIEYYGSASPGGLYGYYSPPRWSPYSPMSTTSYPSPVQSPGSSPRQSDSPSTFTDAPFLSMTYSGGTSPVHGSSSHLDWLSEGEIVQQVATSSDRLEWSPVQHPSGIPSGCDDPTESDDVAVVQMNQFDGSVDGAFDFGLSFSALSGEGAATGDGEHQGDAQPLDCSPCPHDHIKGSRRSVASFPCDLFAADAVCNVEDRPDDDGTSSAASKPSAQRKRSLAPDTISKIRKIVNASTPSSLVDITDIITQGRDNVDPTPPDVYDRHRQPGKVTEHNILILLSRVSYMTDPSSHLLTGDALRGLLEYASMASQPLSRGARILQRVTRNPHCFEPIIRALIPSHIDRILGREFPVASEQRCVSTTGDVGSVAKQLFRSDKSREASDVRTEKNIDMDIDVVHSSPRLPITAEVSERNIGGFDSKLVRNKTKHAESSPCLILVTSDVTRDDRRDDRRDVSNDTTELKRCLLTNLSLLSESRYGRGVISHILLTGCAFDKLKIAISLPFLCRSRELRRKMLLEFRGLDLLLRSLEEPTAAIFPGTIHCLSYLTVSLGLLFHHQQRESKSKTEDATPQYVDAAIPGDVTFILDDGIEVSGRRERLAGKSSVFAAMLEGHYSESCQSCVRIPHVSSSAFKVLVDCLQGDEDVDSGTRLQDVLSQVLRGDSKKCSDSASESDFKHSETSTDVRPKLGSFEKAEPSTDHPSGLDTLLDVLILSNQYLLPDLQHEVSLLLCWRYLARDCVNRVFRLALLHNSAWLAHQCVRYALAQAMSRTERVATMRSMLAPTDMSDTISAIRDVLVSAISG